MSDTTPRRRLPAIMLPQLEAVLTEQRRTRTWLTDQLGLVKQNFRQFQDRGWPPHHAVRIAELLDVPLAVLQAAGPTVATAPASTQALMQQLEIAEPFQRARERILAALDDALAETVTATARLVAIGRVQPRDIVAEIRDAFPEFTRPAPPVQDASARPPAATRRRAKGG